MSPRVLWRLAVGCSGGRGAAPIMTGIWIAWWLSNQQPRVPEGQRLLVLLRQVSRHEWVERMVARRLRREKVGAVDQREAGIRCMACGKSWLR
jgi:hypothetical protein